MRALEQQMAAPSAAAAARAQRSIVPRPAPATSDRYSRCVALLKVVLPVIGIALLCLVSAWSRLPTLLEGVRLGFAAIDLREARELRMVNPRYAGLDRYNRPFAVTAAIGRQVPDRNDVMALEQPKAVMTVHGGASVVVTAATGIYQSQAQLLDLFEDVNLVHQDTTRFVTRRAHLNLSDNTAEGHDPVEGHGPSGDITGEGFLILSKGDTIIFSGQSSLLLKGAKQNAAAVIAPPALPADIEQTAAQVESAAAALPVVTFPTVSPPLALEKPVHSEPTARPAAIAKSQPAVRHVAKTSLGSTPAGSKPRQHGD
jgi:lipopolysaccharide export system protein LptC